MKNNLRRLVCITIMVVIVFLLLVPAFATEKQRVIRIAFPEQTGITESHGDGTYGGYTYDYLEKIAQLTGWKMEYVPIKASTLDEALMKSLEMIQKGQLDLVGCMTKTPELEKIFEYTDDSYGIMYSTLAAREDNLTLNSSNFFLKKPLKVGIRSSAVNSRKELKRFFKMHNVTYKFVEYETYDILMEAFNSGEVDVVPDVSIGSVKGTKQLAMYSSALFYFASTKGNTDLVSDLDKAIECLNKNSPSFQSKLAEKYLNDTLGGFFITEEEKEYIKDKKTIKALCVPDCAPFVFINPEGELCGIAISMMDDFAKQTGITMKYEIYDRNKDFSKAFISEDFDCILGIPVNSTYNTELGVITSSPYLSTEQVYFSKHNSQKKSLKDLKVAMLRGSDYADKIKCKEILYFDTTEECLDAVVSGKADGGYGNQYCVEYYSQHNFINLSIVPIVGENRSMEISINKNDDRTFLALMNRYIENLDSSKIYKFHIATNEEHPNNWFRILMYSDPVKSSFMLAAFVFAIFMAIAMFYFARSSRKKNQQLQIVSNAKSDFLSRVSHDMRTPMNAILSFSSMNLDDKLTEEQLITDMGKINSSGQYLLGLINDVLDMSKIENQKMELRLEPTTLGKLMDGILADIKPMIDEKKLNFKAELNTVNSEPTIMCDVMRTKQIFINLLSNAAKFTPEGGNVYFSIENIEANDEYLSHRFIVRDTGIGMNKEFLQNVFEPFSQEKNDQVGQLTGTGLGLAIVKQLVDLMEGTITVKSQINVGSEFVVELKNKVSVTDSITERDKLAASIVVDEKLAGRRILLCEDHPINAEIVKRILCKKGILVDYAENGQIALDLFINSSIGYYDGILMDIKMPVLDGLAATRGIRNLEREDAKTVVIVAITANAFDEDIEKSKFVGMNAHLSKPIDPKQLYNTLYELIGK